MKTNQPRQSTQQDAPDSNAADARPLLAERLMIEALPEWTGNRALVISPGRAQLATHLLAVQNYRSVQAWYLDLFDAEKASSHLPTDVEVLCGADLPDATYDLIGLVNLKRAEAELTRDLLQQAHERLEQGGYLVASVDNPKDSWLHDQLRGMFDKVTSTRTAEGCIYWARKIKPLKKLKTFDCELSFKDDEQIIQAYTRPGVFSHRRLDAGTRQLLLSCEIDTQDNVLDMGCGCGAVTLAAAARTTGRVFGVDSNARAIDCLERGIAANGCANAEAIWNADGVLELPVEIDIVLANPPYFGDEVIWQHFVQTGLSTLRPGGAILVVTKQPSWYEAYFDALQLEDIVIFEAGHYFVACGRQSLDSSA